MTTARVIAVMLLSLFCFSALQSQQEELLKILKPVDESQRPRLAKRLAMFMDHQRAQQWSKLYELLDSDNAGRLSAEEFAKLMAALGHEDFAPERTEADDRSGSQYRIYGCVRVRENRAITWFQGGLVAYLQEADWYFTPHFLLYDRAGQRLLCTTRPGAQRGFHLAPTQA